MSSKDTVLTKTQYEEESTPVFKLWARLANTRPSVVQKYYESWYETIVRELYTGGSVYLPKMGWIFLKEYTSGAQKQIQPDGTYKYYEVEPRDIPAFRPENDFINDINMKGVTQSWRWRQKHGKPTWRDKERERRAAEILAQDYKPVDCIPITPEIRTLIHQSNYKEKWQKMRKEYEAKLFASINDIEGTDDNETNE